MAQDKDASEKQHIPSKLIPSSGLRWNSGILEQRFLALHGGQEYWIPVPDVQRIKPEPKS